MWSLRCILRIFSFHEKVMFCSWDRYSIYYVIKFYINFEKCYVVMSISTRGRVHSWIYLLNCKLFCYETWPFDKNHVVMDNIFDVSFVWYGGLGPKSKPFWIDNLHLIKNQLWWACGFLRFWRRALRRSKVVNITYYKITDHMIFAILSKS